MPSRLPRNAPAWLDRLSAWLEPFELCFTHLAQRGAFAVTCSGLLSGSRRKSMSAILERVRDPGTYQAFQHFITDAPWLADAVWRHLRATFTAYSGHDISLGDIRFTVRGVPDTARRLRRRPRRASERPGVKSSAVRAKEVRLAHAWNALAWLTEPLSHVQPPLLGMGCAARGTVRDSKSITDFRPQTHYCHPNHGELAAVEADGV